MGCGVVIAVFAPASALLGRLKYAYKIVLVTVVLLLPLGFVSLGYVDIQTGQVAFSAKERDGVAYLRPLLTLTGRTVQARHLAVTGGQPTGADVGAAIAAVDAIDARYGADLGVSQGWSTTKTAIEQAGQSAPGQAAFDGYGKAATVLLELIVAVSDKSNLTLDPDLDSYYLMDVLVFRLPTLLDVIGRAVEEAVLAASGPPGTAQTARLHLARAAGSLANTQAAVDAGLTTAFAKTSRAELSAAKPEVDAARQSMGVVLVEVDKAVESGELTAITPAAGDQARADLTRLMDNLGPQLDALLATRIDGFQSNALVVEIAAVAAVLLVGYLLIGFYRSATVPLRRMVDALRALAGGDLNQQVPVDTRDEVGQMGSALNDALTRVRTAIQAVRDDADGVASASTEMSAVSGELRATAESTAVRAGQVGSVADDVAVNVSAVSVGTDQMSAAIREISSGASQAASVAAEAVDAANTTQQTIGRLGESSTKIG
jgi:methyl-accepting chemotaxis protein